MTNILYTAFFHITLVILVYGNILFIIPKILRKNRFLFYAIIGMVWLIIMSMLNMWSFDYLIDFIFPGYYFISYYEFVDVWSFMLIYFVASSLLKLSKGWFKLQTSEKQIQVLKDQKTKVELEALKAKVNPHFLLNSLNSLYGLSMDDDKEKLSKAILKLSSSMKYVLYETEQNLVPLEKELKYIKDYIGLQKMRLDYPEQVRFILEGPSDNLRIAPFMLIPLVENAFKHGLHGQKEDNFIEIKIKIEEKQLELTVRNNKGSRPTVNEDYGGFGIKNLRKRLKIQYPKKHDFQIVDTNNIYHSKLKLELR